VTGRRVLALVTDAYGAGGGIAQYNRDLFQALSTCEDVGQVLVLARHGKPSADRLPVKVQQIGVKPGRLAYSYRALRAIARQGPVHVIFCGHLFMAPLAAILAKRTGASLWLQIHGIEAWHRPNRFQRWAAERAQLITAVSRYTRRLFLGWANCSPETVKVLPNTVDERFSPGPKPRALLDRHGLGGKKVLLTVSRLAAAERYKGHDLVIRALVGLGASHPDLVYVVAGDGDDRNRLQQLAAALGVAERVRFVGYVPEGELPELYRTADVFVMPSAGEGFGIVFLQALASGLPVIGGDGDGSRDPLRDGHDGCLVAPGHLEGLQAAIAKAMAQRRPRGSADAFARGRFEAAVGALVERLAAETPFPTAAEKQRTF